MKVAPLNCNLLKKISGVSERGGGVGVQEYWSTGFHPITPALHHSNTPIFYLTIE